MQNITSNNKKDDQKQSDKDATQDMNKTRAAASEPVSKPKSGKDLAVEDLAEHYARTKPPGRRYPLSMATDMLSTHVDGDVPDLPVVKGAGEKSKSDESEK